MRSLFDHNSDKFLFLITSIALFVRIIWFMCYTRHENNYKIPIDSDQYYEVASQISKNNGISTKDGWPNFFRLPAYPLFLGYAYKIWGSIQQKTLLLQTIISAVIPMLIFLLASVLFPSNVLVAQISALAAALHPGFILFAGLQATETLFLTFFLLFLIFFFKSLNNSRWYYFCGAGFALGIASLFRALGHYVIALALVLIFLLSKKPLLNRLWYSFLLSLSWLSIVGIWLARNYALTGYIFFHTLPGQHFLRYNAAHNMVQSKNINYIDAKNTLFALRDHVIIQQEKQKNRKLNEPEKDKLTQQLAFDIMKQYPWLTIKHACREIFRTCFSLYASIPFQVPPGIIFAPSTPISFKIKMYFQTLKTYPIIVLFVVWDLFFSCMLLIGFMLFIFASTHAAHWKRLWLTIFPFIILLVFITLSVGLVRLRFPVEPFLIILAVYGWISCYSMRN